MGVKDTLEVGGLSWNNEFHLPSLRQGEISSDDSDDDTDDKQVMYSVKQATTKWLTTCFN